MSSRIALTLIAVASLMGCAPDYTLELTTEDHGATIQDRSVTILVGNAIGVTPLENDDPIDEDERVELESTLPTVMEVRETGEAREFVLWGVSPGRADVEILIDGELEDIIEVEVLPRTE